MDNVALGVTMILRESAICTQLMPVAVRKENKNQLLVGYLDIFASNAGPLKLEQNAHALCKNV